MFYLFLVEDEIFQVFKILLDRIFSEKLTNNQPSRRIKRLPQGVMANPTKIQRIIDSYPRQIKKVYILRDSECTPHDDTRLYLEGKLSPLLRAYPEMIRICIITHAIESWLLYDEEPLKRIFRTHNYNCPSTIEVEDATNDCCHPKKFIRKEFSRHNKDFSISYHGERIAQDLDLQKLERSRSFREFKERLLGDLDG